MRESFMHSRVGLLARTHAFKPIRHVLRGQVVNAERRQFGLTRQKHNFGFPFPVNVRVVFVRAFLFD